MGKYIVPPWATFLNGLTGQVEQSVFSFTLSEPQSYTVRIRLWADALGARVR